MWSCSSSADTPCEVSWPPSQSGLLQQVDVAAAARGGERRGDAAGAAADDQHLAGDLARRAAPSTATTATRSPRQPHGA